MQQVFNHLFSRVLALRNPFAKLKLNAIGFSNKHSRSFSIFYVRSKTYSRMLGFAGAFALNPDFRVAFPTKGDWDDMAKKDGGGINLLKCLLEGELYRAKTGPEAARVFALYLGYTPTVFEWKGAFYSDTGFQILDGVLRGSHSFYGYDYDNNKGYKHYLDFKARGSEHYQRFSVNGTHLSSAIELDKKMIDSVRKSFKGSRNHIAYILEKLVKLDNKPSVLQYDRFGYHPQTKSYVFQSFAVDRDGLFSRKNKNEYFDKLNVAPMSSSSNVELYIAERQAGIGLDQVISDIYQAWGNRGIAALAYYVATLFSSAITFPRFKCHPHLSLYGARNTGKSMLTQLLNRMFTLEDREGHVLKQTSTPKSINRILAGKNSLSVVFLEGNTEERLPIKENDLLCLYNRQSPQTRANRTMDNTINELEYDAGLVMVQNVEWFLQGAVKQRFISVKFEDKGGQFTQSEDEAYNRLSALTPDQCADVGLSVLENRKYFEDHLLSRIEASQEFFNAKGLKNKRIVINHALLLGALATLCDLAGGVKCSEIFEGAKGYFLGLVSVKSKQAINTHDGVNHFIEAFNEQRFANKFDAITEGDHYILEDSKIFIRITETLKSLRYYTSFDPRLLVSQLRNHDKFVSEGKKRSNKWNKKDDRPRCLVFDSSMFDLENQQKPEEKLELEHTGEGSSIEAIAMWAEEYETEDDTDFDLASILSEVRSKESVLEGRT